MIICQPNEIVILSGRKRRQADGSVLGYRIIRGGRGFKWPFVESVARLPLTTHPIEIFLAKAMCGGMIPVSIEGRANVKLAGRSNQGLDSAVERFLGKGVDAVTRTSQQVIEGALRGVVATVSPEEANTRRLELADQVTERARADLSPLGIVLDFVQIQSISDDQGYLEAIGRQRNAVVPAGRPHRRGRGGGRVTQRVRPNSSASAVRPRLPRRWSSSSRRTRSR